MQHVKLCVRSNRPFTWTSGILKGVSKYFTADKGLKFSHNNYQYDQTLYHLSIWNSLCYVHLTIFNQCIWHTLGNWWNKYQYCDICPPIINMTTTVWTIIFNYRNANPNFKVMGIQYAVPGLGLKTIHTKQKSKIHMGGASILYSLEVLAGSEIVKIHRTERCQLWQPQNLLKMAKRYLHGEINSEHHSVNSFFAIFGNPNVAKNE